MRRFYGPLDRETQEIVGFYLSREQAERAIGAVLRDAPSWVGKLAVVLVDSRTPRRSSA
jgi:hypothetical protein